jgi:GH24 family phage-related lysozyme (muramidase)
MNGIHFGVVEDRLTDPLKIGRCKVRISGIHTEDKQLLPTDSLPWAIVMQPTTSAANSGIGQSPTGIVEGTWVMIVFRDEFNQFPVIIGTLPGVPTKEESPAKEGAVVRSGDGTVWKDSSGSPISTGYAEDSTVKQDTAATEPKKPSALSMSENGYKELRESEALSSLTKGKNKRGSESTPSSTKIYSYQDSTGVWTIGWGNTILSDGSRVDADTSFTKAEADALLKERVTNDYEKSTRRLVKVPLTQSMFDACTSMIYNMGASNFKNSDFLARLNAGKYEVAASTIPLTLVSVPGVYNRRVKEKTLFMKDGIPQDDGSVKELPKEAPVVDDKSDNPVVQIIPSKDPNKVPPGGEVGFKDPAQKYPKFLDEPDTNRLARHDKIDGTVVYKKEAARAKKVKTAKEGETWDQPKIPYNAKYPYNQVYSSESGHLQEFDDTEGNERIHTYHKSGTFTEVDKNGTMVRRIVGDAFDIYERNGNVVIRGKCNITVEGDAQIRVERDSIVETVGDMKIRAGRDLEIAVGRKFRVLVGNDRYMEEPEWARFSVDTGNPIKSGRVDFNNGDGFYIKHNEEERPEEKKFEELQVPNRNTESDSNYETPEEGANTDFIEKQVAEGKIDEADAVPTKPTPETTKEEVEAVKKQPAPVIKPGCDLIFKETNFTRAYKLTDISTLGDTLGSGRSGIPSGVNYGMTAPEIICNLKQLTENVLDPIRKRYPNMKVTSAWRSQSVNDSAGGSKTSDHLFGQAADIVFDGMTREDHYRIVQDIQKMLPAYNQLILEYKGSSTWIHVSYKSSGNKTQAFTMDAARNKTIKANGFILV